MRCQQRIILYQRGISLKMAASHHEAIKENIVAKENENHQSSVSAKT